MISFRPFWNTLDKSNESQYTLIKRHKMSASTIYRLKHNLKVTTRTIEKLCCILDCDVYEIVEYIECNT